MTDLCNVPYIFLLRDPRCTSA